MIILTICIFILAGSINQTQLFQNRDVLRDDIISFASIRDLQWLCLVSSSLAIEIKSILETRKLLKSEHTRAIKSIIEQLHTSEHSDKLMTQFVHGFFGHTQNLLVLVCLHPEQHDDIANLGLSEPQRLWLKNSLLGLKDLLNDYAAIYDPTQLLLTKMDNSTKLYAFMRLQQQSERLITKLEAACERVKDVARNDLYQDTVISVWSTSVYLRLLMQSIGTNVGCPQIINLYEQNCNIGVYWDKCYKAFQGWKNITHADPPANMNATSASTIRYTILSQNAPLIDELIEFMAKVKEYVIAHQLTNTTKENAQKLQNENFFSTLDQ